jgi:hypothetical protein
VSHSGGKSGLSDRQIDVMAGFCAGIISNFIAHPLDTIKVRMQTDKTQSLKLVPTIKSIYQAEGVSLSIYLE